MKKIDELDILFEAGCSYSGGEIQEKINEIIDIINEMNNCSKKPTEPRLKTGADIRRALDNVKTREDLVQLLTNLEN